MAEIQAQELQTNVKQGAVIGGWVCFGVGILFMFFSLWTFIFYGSLFFAAFVLSIVAMAQRRVGGGLVLLLCCVIVPPVMFFGLAAERAGHFASKSLASQPQSLASPSAQLGDDSWKTLSNGEFATPEGRAGLPPGSVEINPNEPVVSRRAYEVPKPENAYFSAQGEAAVADTTRTNVVRVYSRGVFAGYTKIRSVGKPPQTQVQRWSPVQ